MSPVQQWVEEHHDLLEMFLGASVRALDFSDDRLAAILDCLGTDDLWEPFETEFNRHILRAYDLQGNQVRIDSSMAKKFVKVTQNGLFQLGHSKDNRPDLPQVKINMSTLDPLGFPLTTTIVSGEKADDPLYLPEIRKVREMLGQSGMTYIGDSKMAAMETRATVAGNKDFYLCPLPGVQMSDSALERILSPVWDGTQALFTVNQPSDDPNAIPNKIAEGFVSEVFKTAVVDGHTISWSERQVVVLSLKFADRQADAFRKRMDNARTEIEKLNEQRQGKKCFTAEADLRVVVDAIIKKYRVEGVFRLTYEIQRQEHNKRGYLGHPARLEVTTFASVFVQVDAAAVAHAIRKMGWRVYVTNQPDLTLEQTVLAYRDQYLIERGFRRLKDKPLTLTPMYLNSDQRIKGLIRLMTIALRILTLMEFQVRQSLQKTGEKLKGLYPGNPKRSTANPTTEMMLKMFRGLNMTYMWDEGTERTHVTPLSETQQRILALLDLPNFIYTDLV